MGHRPTFTLQRFVSTRNWEGSFLSYTHRPIKLCRVFILKIPIWAISGTPASTSVSTRHARVRAPLYGMRLAREVLFEELDHFAIHLHSRICAFAASCSSSTHSTPALSICSLRKKPKTGLCMRSPCGICRVIGWWGAV